MARIRSERMHAATEALVNSMLPQAVLQTLQASLALGRSECLAFDFDCVAVLQSDVRAPLGGPGARARK